jgi:hypothetical protein
MFSAKCLFFVVSASTNHCKRVPRWSIIWLTKGQIRFAIILWCFIWGVFVTQASKASPKCRLFLQCYEYTSGESSQDNCEAYLSFVSQMILHLGTLLQWCLLTTGIFHTFSRDFPLKGFSISVYEFNLKIRTLTRKYKRKNLSYNTEKNWQTFVGKSALICIWMNCGMYYILNSALLHQCWVKHRVCCQHIPYLTNSYLLC